MEKTAILIVTAPSPAGGQVRPALAVLDGAPVLKRTLEAALRIENSLFAVVTDGSLEDLREALPKTARTAESREEVALLLEGFTGTVLMIGAELALLSSETLLDLLAQHHAQHCTLSILATRSGAGRPIRLDKGQVVGIGEKPERLLASDEAVACGVCAVDASFLKPILKSEPGTLQALAAVVIQRAVAEGQTTRAFFLRDSIEAALALDASALLGVSRALQRRRIAELERAGVVVLDPETLHLDPCVSVAAGAVIGPCTQLLGQTVIESGVVIEGCCFLRDVTARAGASLKLGVRAEKSEIGPKASVGPFAHLREGSLLGESTRVGNFVETKKAVLAKGAKASHLTYLGDCSVGEDTNIGAGTITCNYDGYTKAKTVIGKNVFIGSNSALVAPVAIEDGATVGAGSVITKPVEQDSLAFTRPPQVSKAGWSKRKREQHRKTPGH